MNVTITKRLEVDTGHRLLKHEGKCRNYHGHRYAVEVTVSAPQLDEVGRIVDFSAIKDIFGKWLDDHIDHGMVLQEGDPMIPMLREQGCKLHVIDEPPTAENFSMLFLRKAAELLPAPLTVVALVVYETPTCSARAERALATKVAKLGTCANTQKSRRKHGFGRRSRRRMGAGCGAARWLTPATASSTEEGSSSEPTATPTSSRKACPLSRLSGIRATSETASTQTTWSKAPTRTTWMTWTAAGVV